MDETQFQFNMPLSNIIDVKGKNSVIIKTSNQRKTKSFCSTCKLADGTKLAPYLIFKGKNNLTILKRELKNEYVKNKKVFFTFNKNTWSTFEIMMDWIENVWKNYIEGLGTIFNPLLTTLHHILKKKLHINFVF